MDISNLLGEAVDRGASDVHLSAGLPPMIRVDGDIEPLSAELVSSDALRAWIDANAPEPDRQVFADRHEADFCLAVPAAGRFRVNVFQSQRGAGAVCRTIPTKVPTLSDLGLGPTFRRIAEAPRGLVLVTGPTGSGKSTTLAALIDHVNATRRGHILTIEDPIEFVHEPRNCVVNQREVGRDTLTLADALRAALREDPDVILIGELRDLDTIRLALTAAETGHAVFASLHTPSAPKAVDRIVDVFSAAEKETIRSILSESLHAVVWQTLLKRRDDTAPGEGQESHPARGRRIAAHEILTATTAIRNLIREQKIAQIYSAMQTSSAAGMQTLDQSLQRLVSNGEIDEETARENARFGGLGNY